MKVPTLLAFLAFLAFLAAPLAAQCELFKDGGPSGPVATTFGAAVSMDAERLAVGQPHGGPHGTCRVYERFDGGWLVAANLQASDAHVGDIFGEAVAIEGDTLLVGAPVSAGAVYVFERLASGVWTEVQKLTPPDTDAHWMGRAIALDGGRAAVGAAGAAATDAGRVYVYEDGPSGWALAATIQPVLPGGVADAGRSVALQGDRLVIGAPGDSPGLFGGRALVYQHAPAGPGWDWKATLAPTDLGTEDRFGYSVALDGDTVLVGAPWHDLPDYVDGAVYAFDLAGGVWAQTQKLGCGEPFFDNFGRALDLQGDRAVVSALTVAGIGALAGRAFRFERTFAGWTFAGGFEGSDLVPGDLFGSSLDLDGERLAVGAPNQYVYATAGAVHLFAFDAGPHLTAHTPAVSLAQGGAQGLHLGACPAHAGDLYLVAGTASGTSPGFLLAGLPVPLNPDGYFLFTLNHVGAPPLAGALGVLDAFGRGEASFAVPAGTSPALAGLVLHHAYAVLDAATLGVEALSPGVAVTLAP